MIAPVEVKARNLRLRKPLADEIRLRIERLEGRCRGIRRCNVVLEALPRRAGVRVRVAVKVPGANLVVRRRGGPGCRQAVRDAFDALDRRLEADFPDRGEEDILCGWVSALDPAQGFGLIRDALGRELFFHERSVGRTGFSRLKVGTVVRYTEEPGDLGPRASRIRPAGGWSRQGG